MNTTLLLKNNSTKIILDVVALLVVAFMPAISHFLPIPLYLIEPMRLFVVLALLLTGSTNAYVLAVLLPLVAASTSHPVFAKSLLIAIELVLNVALFAYCQKAMKNVGLAIFVSVLTSKMIYYALKYGFLQMTWLSGNLISTSIFVQLVVAVGYGVMTWVFFRNYVAKS